MRQYKTYLFDFDYTLVDSSNGIVMCFRHVMDKHGYKNVDDRAIKRTIGMTLDDAFALLTGVSGREVLVSYRKEYVAKADVCMSDNTILFSEVTNVLQALKQQGSKIGVISTKYRYRIMEFVNRHFPAGFFDIVVGGEDVSKAKPSPEGVWYAMKQLNSDTRDCLYVGDCVIDAQTAQAAALDFVGVLHGTTTREELLAYPHIAIIDDLGTIRVK